MEKRHRPILPALPQPESASSNVSRGPIQDDTDQPLPKRRRPVRVACMNCRAKKYACDGERPTCARCSRQNRDCSYASVDSNETRTMALKRQVDELQQTLSEHAEIIEHLRSVPEPEAISTIRRLRTTPNASMVLSSLRGAAHTTARPSEIRTSRAILPPTEFELEFELTMRHNTVYRNLIPLDLDSIDIDKLTSFSPRQLSPVLAPPGTGHLIEASSSTTNVTILPPSALRGVRSRNISPVAGPEPDRQHCDSRLNQLKIGYWTCVPISDEFAACVLSHYLESDHPIYAAVDADLFLSDLADRTFDHCSPFLVSALMSFACQSYTQFDKRASALSAAFIDEAQRLWQAEQRSQTPNQVAGLVYLALATGISGRDELGIFYAAECRKLAEVMNLFGVQPTETLVSTFHCLSPDKIKSLAFAAWGAFAWLGFRNIYYPGKPIAHPPFLPVPGDTERQTNFGSLLSWPPHPIPAYMGNTYQTLSRFWVIIQEIHIMYNLSDTPPLIKNVPLAYAESKYQSLLHWSDSLLPDMLQGDESPSHVLFFHALYHSTVLYLFQPFHNSTEQLRLRSFSAVDATPSVVYSASLNQLKRLIYINHTREPRLPTNCWFNVAVLSVSTEILKRRGSDSDWYFYFLLCFKYWIATFVCYRPFRLIAQANLAAALECGALDSDTASVLMEEISNVGKHHVAADEAVISGLLDFDLATKTLKEAQIVAVAKRFDELILFGELTTGCLDSTTDTTY